MNSPRQAFESPLSASVLLAGLLLLRVRAR
jgi:hypothetical protein